MIKSWQHKGLAQFYQTGSKAGIQAAHERRLKVLLQTLDAATGAEDMNLPGFRLHKLKGKEKEFYSVTVQANWRIIFKFEGEDALLVDYLDYH